MRELDRIADQLQHMISGGAWHGPALHELLRGIDATDAFLEPPGAPHTIHALVLHLTVWLDVVRRRLEGEVYEPSPEQDWPHVETGQLAWSATLQSIDVAATQLQDLLRRLPDEVLTRQVVGRDYDGYHMLHGVIQHTAYHLGQIALMKRLI